MVWGLGLLIPHCPLEFPFTVPSCEIITSHYLFDTRMSPLSEREVSKAARTHYPIRSPRSPLAIPLFPQSGIITGCRQNTMTCGHTSEGTLVRLRFLGAIWGQNLCPSPLGHPGEVLSSHSATKSRKNLEAGLLLDPNTRLQ